MEMFSIRNPGSMTTVQDLGRPHYLDRGVPLSGALDAFACRVANLLVGNPEASAVLEITVTGPVLDVLAAADIALTGAEMGMTVNGNPVAGWRAFRVKPGDVIRIPRALRGCRSCLAVTGGIAVPEVMGSRSTFVKAQIGGVAGRARAVHRGGRFREPGDANARGAGPGVPHRFAG